MAIPTPTLTVKDVELLRELGQQLRVHSVRCSTAAGSGHPVLYGPDEKFPVGGSKVLRRSDADQVALIGACVTLYNCLAAAKAGG